MIEKSQEKIRMQSLAGIISENTHLREYIESNKGLILKIDESVRNQLKSIQITTEPHGEVITNLSEERLHITLTSIKEFDKIENGEKFKYSLIKIPEIKLGKYKFVYRGEDANDRSYLIGGKVCFVVAIENQDELKDYVNSLYEEFGSVNPEPNRFFHITIANNYNGNSFDSIGNVDKTDFI